VSETPNEGAGGDRALAAFNVSVVLYYTAQRPSMWKAHDEEEYVRSNTVVGPHALAGVDVTHFAPFEEAEPAEQG
jgi:hypothetical protein